MFGRSIAAASLLLASVGTALSEEAVWPERDATVMMSVNEPEVVTDTREAEAQGYRILRVEEHEGAADAMIARDIMPKLEAGLPEPKAAFGYEFADVDGDGGPEMFVKVKHWSLCERGCPMHLFRFDPKVGRWNEFFVVSASLLGVKAPRGASEKPSLLALVDPVDVESATVVRRFEMVGGLFVERKPDAKPAKARK